MKLIDGIKHIIDGNAVIIMGAGASYGAKNAYGDFPSGASLASELYQKCEVVPDDKYDLQDAAQCYEEVFSTQSLIAEIRTRLICTSFTLSHETIYTLPWMRYYTTNYDDVAVLAARKHDITITPVTLSSNLSRYLGCNDRLCVHINGHISELNESTLHNEFKLTANSYLSQENILNSPWGDLLINDLEAARCIVIVGLSLKNDLDLNKIIFNPDFAKKTIIIDKPDLTLNAEGRLKRYGTVYKIGVDGFATAISDVKAEYKPQSKLPSDRLYSAFVYEHQRKFEFSAPDPEDIFKLFLNGHYSDHLFYKRNGAYCGIIYRKKFSQIKSAILSGKRIVFIHADMGNGKTACINELRHALSKEDYHVFTLCNADSPKISEEIAAISALAKKAKVLVIIDDYTNYIEILDKFSVCCLDQIQLVLTARTALNHNKMPTILENFQTKEDSSAVFDMNKLEDADLNNCVKLFDEYGLFGTRSKCSFAEKKKYIISRKGGGGRFQTIMLDVLHSDIMKGKIVNLVQLIKNDSKPYHNAVLLILLVEVMNLRMSTLDIERISGITLSTDALFKSNPAIQELIYLNDTNAIRIKAPVTAKFILQEVSEPESIIESLYSLASYAEKYSEIPKYSQILTSIISYSHINSFLRSFANREQFLSEYYDKLSKIEYFHSNNFFWLQYAISCIETQKFDRAQRYLETAYGLIPSGFVPFQINNQQARLYLERIVCGQSKQPVEDFISAHKLLMIPIASPKDNEYTVVKLFGYYYRKKVIASLSGDANVQVYKSACKEAYSRVSSFIEKHPLYSNDLKDLQVRLLSAYCN